MTQILKTFRPLRATKQGLRAVKEDAFKQACKRLVISACVQDAPKDIWESRLNLLTLETLLPKYNHNPEDCETYIKAHVHEVYGYWHAAVGELIRELAADRRRTIARELGITIPADDFSAAVADKQIPGGHFVNNWKEGVDFRAA
jgi:hypothetical protein